MATSPHRVAPRNKHNWFPDLPQKITPTTISVEENFPTSALTLNDAEISHQPTETSHTRRHSKTSTSSKSTNPPSDEEYEDDGTTYGNGNEEFEWGFHCTIEPPPTTHAPAPRLVQIPVDIIEGVLSSTSPPPRRYSAGDVDYLKHAMFVLECEQDEQLSFQTQIQKIRLFKKT